MERSLEGVTLWRPQRVLRALKEVKVKRRNVSVIQNFRINTGMCKGNKLDALHIR
jgi:hypothetical protein